MNKLIITTVIALGFGISIAALGSTAPDTDNSGTSGTSEADDVSSLSPQQMCNLVYINYPRRHWCDRRGHVHWRK